MPTLEGDRTANRPEGDDPAAATRKNEDNHGVVIAERPRLFAGLSQDEFAGICRAARVKQFARGEVAHIEGNSVERVFLIASGCVKVTKLSAGGSEVILRLDAHGDVLSAVDLFSSGKHCSTAEVFRACRVLMWDAKVFKGLVERYPVLHRNMVAILDEHLRELEDRFREVATERVGPRVALQLLRLLKTIGRRGKAGTEVCLSRQELAQMTGTTLFTVSRLLSAWEERGVVRPRREAVAICDVPSLRLISEEA